MENTGIQNSIGAFGVNSGNLRAAQAIYESVSSSRKPSANNGLKSSGSTGSYSVSISSQGRQMAEANFRREQQSEAADFKRQEQQQEADFNQEQMRAQAEFQRQERRKEAEFNRRQQQDALAFEQNQRQKEAGFQRQLSRYSGSDVNNQEL